MNSTNSTLIWHKLLLLVFLCVHATSQKDAKFLDINDTHDIQFSRMHDFDEVPVKLV
jgi:hypothetical protein